MHQNISLPSAFYYTSDTNDSIKQDLSNFLGTPFTLSLSTNSNPRTHRTSLRSLWTNSQKEKYSIFSLYFRQFLTHFQPENINWNIFKAMAKFVKTRNPQQCRSHHLKLIKQFNGTAQFFYRSFKRIRRLQEKMHQAQKVLVQIQEEFQLFYVESINQTKIKQNFFIENELTEKNDFAIQKSVSQNALDKQDKQELKKTATSYQEAENPVKNNIFFDGQSQQSSFTNVKTKLNRCSLPSFDNDKNMIQNHEKHHLLIGQNSKQSTTEFKDFNSPNLRNVSIQMNVDTIKVPDHIETTTQMQILFKNSSNNLGIQGQKKKL